jgi:hypothetical protein
LTELIPNFLPSASSIKTALKLASAPLPKTDGIVTWGNGALSPVGKPFRALTVFLH